MFIYMFGFVSSENVITFTLDHYQSINATKINTPKRQIQPNNKCSKQKQVTNKQETGKTKKETNKSNNEYNK